MQLPPFHLAIPVKELEETKSFYVDILGCSKGRTSEVWQDLDFFGHQLVLHINKNFQTHQPSNEVDGKHVPIPHFGVVLEWDIFNELAASLKEKHIEFVIEPYIRFEGQIGEQATMFFYDPSGNALEFKAFKNPQDLFAK